jgi:hypothetical protein
MKVGKQGISSGLQFVIDFAKIFTIFWFRGFLTIEIKYYT